MHEIKTYFGKNLKKIRKSKGYSQEYIAEKIGIDRRQLTRIETGKSFPSFRTLDVLCIALGIEPQELFDFSEYKTIANSQINNDISENEIILSEIKNKILDYQNFLPKLKFIQLALNCLENKKYIEKLQNMLDGMLL